MLNSRSVLLSVGGAGLLGIAISNGQNCIRCLSIANEILPSDMSKALEEIERLPALNQRRCKQGDIRKIHEPLKVDIADQNNASRPNERKTAEIRNERYVVRLKVERGANDDAVPIDHHL
jgi:hypothetical protein